MTFFEVGGGIFQTGSDMILFVLSITLFLHISTFRSLGYVSLMGTAIPGKKWWCTNMGIKLNWTELGQKLFLEPNWIELRWEKTTLSIELKWETNT